MRLENISLDEWSIFHGFGNKASLSPLLFEHGQFKAHELVYLFLQSYKPKYQTSLATLNEFFSLNEVLVSGCFCWVCLSWCSVNTSAHLGIVVTTMSHLALA